MIVVTEENFGAVIECLRDEHSLALDTETTGLRPYHGDTFFCIAIANNNNEHYFSFHPEHPNYLHENHLKALDELLFRSNQGRIWFGHHLKFDLAMLATRGCELVGTLRDTKAMARLLYNDRLRYDLDTCAKDVGQEKDDAVKKYILEHGLWEWQQLPGKAVREKKMFFDRVPYDIIAPYACRDVRITYDLAVFYEKETRRLDDAGHAIWPKARPTLDNEAKLTRTVYDMERRGVKINSGYCQLAVWTLDQQLKELEARFYEETGIPFKNSSKVFREVFKGEGFNYGKPTATGKINPKFDSAELGKFKHPAATTVLQWRDAKKTSEYFHNFLYYADKRNVIHANFNQDGTATGRFSASQPNLQNLTKDEDGNEGGEFLVRRAFIPRDGYFFAMFDFDQMEYKLMLDYAGAKGLIEQVKAGVDVHQATADAAGIKRSTAKTVNFSVLYGAGDRLLAERLGTNPIAARQIKNSIFMAAPEIPTLISDIQYSAIRRGFIYNWAGRRYYFPNKKFAYKAPNYLIQGGCADIIKIGMNRVADYLQPFRSKMVMSIHDEIVVECHKNEMHILPEIKRILEDVYPPKNGLAMSCGVDHSFKNLADKIEGFPDEARDHFQKQSSSTLPEEASPL